MLRNTRRTLLAILPIVLLWAGCATSGTMNEGAENNEQAGAGLTVAVNNDLTVPSSVTVWLVQENGSAQLLGTASPNDKATFPVRQSIIPGIYILRARTTGGQVYESNPFNLTSGMDTVSWDLQLNTLGM